MEALITLSVIAALDKAWACRNSNRAAARSAAETFLTGAERDPRAIALAKVVLSYLDYRERRYERAAAAGLEALAVLEANPVDPWLPRLYNTLAIIHFDLGERDASRAYLDRQIRLSQEIGDRTYEALGYHDLGLLQAAVDTHRGLATLAQARVLFQASGDAENEALSLYNMANIHQHAGECEQATTFARQALQFLRARGTHGLGFYLAIHLSTLMAEIARACGRHGEAQGLLNEAQTLALPHFPELLPHVQFCQGLHRVAVGDDAGAAPYFRNALAQLGPSGSYELLADCHAALADCMERLGDYRAALSHYRAYASIREHTFTEASEQKVRALDVIHQVETTRRAAEAERQRNSELQHYIQELEQLQAKLQAMSVRDPLTNLHNRRYLAEEGSRLLAAAQGSQAGLCAVMCDVDHFKQINDTLGHHIGDLVLQHLAEIMGQVVRATDLITRYGGEELIILLPSTRLDAAFRICERLRAAVEQYDWGRIHADLRVTISIGLAEDAGGTLAELLASADTQLYVAKRAGRNRIRYERGDAQAKDGLSE